MNNQVTTKIEFPIKTIQVKEFSFKQTGPFTKGETINMQQGIGAIAEKNEVDYILQSKVDISFLQNKKEIFYIKFVVVGVIGIEPNFDEKQLNDMVKIMYSYLRPLVAQMTVMANLPPLNLPPLNFEGLEVEVKQNNIKKRSIDKKQ